MARIFANFININKGREGRESLPQKKTLSHQNQSVVIKPTKKNEQDNDQGKNFAGIPTASH